MNNSSYKKVLKSMPVGYALHQIIQDRDGLPVDYEFIDVNSAFEAATGLEASHVIGRRVTEVIPAIREDRFDWIATYGDVALNETVLNLEHFSEALGRWYRINAYSPERGYFVTLFSDITIEKEEFKVSSESEKKLKSYIDAAPLGIIAITADGRFLEVNAQACAISGYTPEELIKIKPQRLVAAQSRILALMFFNELIGASQADCQLQIKTKVGELRWLSIHAHAQSDNRFLLYCQDITSHKELEDDLIKSELLYRTFINASNNIIYLKDDHLRYMIVNNALLDACGLESSEIIGRKDSEVALDFHADETDMAAITSRNSSVTEFSHDGTIYEAVKFPVPIGNLKTGVGAYIRDITEEKKQEEKLKRTMARHRILASALMMTFQTGQEQLEYALGEALTLTGSQHGYIFTYDEDRRELTLNCWTKGVLSACMIPDMKHVYALDQTGIWGEAIRHRSPTIFNNFDKPHPLKRGYPEGHIALKNYLSVPIIVNDKIVAAVGLANKASDYDEVDVSELTMLMTGVWTAVEKKNVQKRMENLFEQTQAMFNEHDAIMLLLSPVSGQIIDANPAAVSFYGYSKDDLLSLTIDDINDGREHFEPASDPERRRFYSTSHRLKNGHKRVVDVYSCPITHNNDQVVFSIIFDVTEREKAFAEIKYLSFHDHLTGLYNRRYFDSVLCQMNDEQYMPLTIVMADVNGLKLINDSFGHIQGDELLRSAAAIIKEGCRKEDISARIGGDEFVIILPNTDNTEAGKIVRRIKKLQSKVKIKQLDLSLSFGYAVKHTAAADMDLVVSEAENKMYKNKMHESASTRNKTVSIIMKTLYEKCSGEVGHSSRVSKISEAIAAEMNFDAEQLTQISVAGLLHDIGKIGIDDGILTKRGVFTKAEREEIQKHSESGWRILCNSDEHAGIADYILYHHEYIDGKGYPRGIRGDAIPLVSKIIAVADAYDAMTSDRPYRTRMTKEEAIEELIHNSSTQFDKEVVTVFIENVLNSGRYNDI
ncbi:PAS domain S-box protein [Oscillospiraceae bacterium WX1]